MKRMILLFICFICLNNVSLFGQNEKFFFNNFGIELGAGYNTLTSKYTNIGQTVLKFDYVVQTNAFWIQPSARLFYSITLHNFSDSLHKKLKMPVFIGYYTFGGAEKGNGFRTMDVPSSIVSPDKIIIFFRSIELGINPCFEKNKIQIGALLKGQYIFAVRNRTYHDPLDNGIMIQDGVMIQERDISNDYKKIAMNSGIKLKYKIIKGFSIAGEAWFGITNLYAHTNYGNEGKLRVTENNYRLLLGYEW